MFQDSTADDMKVVTLKVGVLAIQGGFSEHKAALIKALELYEFQELIKIQVTEVRDEEHLRDLDGLVLPGGESTTMGIFLKSSGLDVALSAWIKDKTKPRVVWGTCAGLILMSNRIEGQKPGGQVKIGGLDITTSRNYFGRQLDSFESVLEIKDPSLQKKFTSSVSCKAHDKSFSCKGVHGVFIRAPAVLSVDDPGVQTLATVNVPCSDKPVVVAVAQGNLMATAFHPELTEDAIWHAYFLERVLNAKMNIM